MFRETRVCDIRCSWICFIYKLGGTSHVVLSLTCYPGIRAFFIWPAKRYFTCYESNEIFREGTAVRKTCNRAQLPPARIFIY